MDRYAANYGKRLVAKVITAGGAPPIIVKSEPNPEGTPIEASDGIRAGMLKDASQFYIDMSEAFFGAYQTELDQDILAFIKK